MIPAKNLMLDLETLSTQPDAAVFELGLVEFTPHEVGENHLNLVWVPEGGHVDPRTVQWWQQRDEPCSLKGAHMEEAEAVKLIYSYLHRRQDFMLWAQPASFDCIILQSLLRRYGHELPIGFRKWRDVRTVRELANWPKTDYREGANAHTAFDDCVRQIDTLHACWKVIK